MSLPSLSIKRPVSTLMFFLGIVVFGFISVTFLSQELFPPVVYPKLTVVTHYANAAPEEIETLITKPIEEAVGSTAGLRRVSSVSREGISMVVAEFGWNQNMDFAALGVREKIDLMKARLPRDAEEPTVKKSNPFELPVMKLSVSSEIRDPVKLKRFTEKWIKNEIEKITGIASAVISGGADEEIVVEVDQGRLKASEIGILDVSKGLTESNINYPGGTIKENFYEYLVRTMGEFKNVDEIGRIAVAQDLTPEGQDFRKQQNNSEQEAPSHKLILLRDVATVERRTKEQTSYSRFDGLDNITIAVQKQANANTIQVAREIKKRLVKLKRQIPEDIQIEIITNQADFIQEAIGGVRDAALQGGVLTFLVLLVFLRNLRSAILVVVVIPVTLMATLTVMYFMGISLNVISLGGLALGIGMLIDSAIVVIENVFRHTKEFPDADVRETTARATEEVVAPLIASMLTTVMVFLPMIFVSGIAGQIFKDLAWVVVMTQIFSIIAAFTLLPMLIVQFNSARSSTGGVVGTVLGVVGTPIAALGAIYQKVLPLFLRLKIIFLPLVVVACVASVYWMGSFERILMPRIDQGQFVIKLDLPVGARIERTNEIAKGIEGYIRKLPQVDRVSAAVGSSGSGSDDAQGLGSHQSQIDVTLKDDRDISTAELIQKIRADFRTTEIKRILKNTRYAFVLYESAFRVGGEQSAPVVIDIKGNNLDILGKLAETIQAGLEEIPGIYDAANTIPESAPETKIIVNKDKAAFYQISVTDLATAAHISIKGTVATKLKEESKEIDIRVVLKEESRDAVGELPFIQMHSPLGPSVPLNDLVEFQSGYGPSQIKREDQERTIQVYAKVFERSMNDILADVDRLLAETNIPKNYQAGIAGERAEMKESFQSLAMAIVLSVILIYMIMAAQFESYFQPFIIMFTLPLSLIGVALALGMSGTAVSVVVILGIILLGGIVVNNGIILIDFINMRIRSNVSAWDALLEAGTARFRPILMTASTTVLGWLPLALGLGEGSKLLSPLAIAVMGGLLTATFLTLVVIPAVYHGANQIGRLFSGKS